MKKLIALLLAVSVLFSLALTGCKSETPDDIGDNETLPPARILTV